MNTALGRTETARLQNKSGAAVAFGDVVVISNTDSGAFTTTNTEGYIDTRIGVVIEPAGIAANGYGIVAFSGYVPVVNLVSAANIGDHVSTSSTSGKGKPAILGRGTFAQVLNAGTSPEAILFGSQYHADGAGVYFAPKGLSGATQSSRYVGATLTGAPTSGTFATGDYVVALNGAIWVCTSGGSPGTWVQIGSGGGGTTITVAMASISTQQSVAQTEVRINFNNVLADPDNAITTGANWVFTAPDDGKYIFNISIGRQTSGELFATAYHNGAQYPTGISLQAPATTSWNSIRVNYAAPMSSGDTMYITLRSPSGTANTWIGPTLFNVVYFS